MLARGRAGKPPASASHQQSSTAQRSRPSAAHPIEELLSASATAPKMVGFLLRVVASAASRRRRSSSHSPGGSCAGRRAEGPGETCRRRQQSARPLLKGRLTGQTIMHASGTATHLGAVGAGDAKHVSHGAVAAAGVDVGGRHAHIQRSQHTCDLRGQANGEAEETGGHGRGSGDGTARGPACAATAGRPNCGQTAVQCVKAAGAPAPALECRCDRTAASPCTARLQGDRARGEGRRGRSVL